MTKKQLPPELVEKIREAWNKPDSVQQCAKIAVDYAEEEKKELTEGLKNLIEAVDFTCIGYKFPITLEKSKQLIEKNG